MIQTICHSKALEKLELIHKQSGGHCGLYITDFEGELYQLRTVLNNLFIEDKITIHDGIHGKLIKKKDSKNKKLIQIITN